MKELRDEFNNARNNSKSEYEAAVSKLSSKFDQLSQRLNLQDMNIDKRLSENSE